MITIRPAVEADYPCIVAITNAQIPRPINLDSFVEAQRKRPESVLFQRLVAILPDGCLVGFGVAGENDEALTNHFFVTIRVAVNHRHQGAGSGLLNALVEWARSHGAVCLECGINDQDEETMAWIRKRGFVLEGQVAYSELDVSGWDEQPFIGIVRAAQGRGVRFVTLQKLGITDENLCRFHGMCQTLEHHVPGRSPLTPPYEQWLAKIAQDPGWDPERVLIAVDGHAWAGLSYMEQHADGSWYTHLTGVDPAYRGQGLGLALKVAAVQHAKAHDVPYLSTYNHMVNAAMLRINERLGYVQKHGVYQIHLPLLEHMGKGDLK